MEAETIHNCVNNLNYIAKTFRKTGWSTRNRNTQAQRKNFGFRRGHWTPQRCRQGYRKVSLKRVDFSHCFLVSTGRLTSDIVSKTARVGIPIVASIAAVLDSGIEIAKKANLTLIGFVRGRRMNIYNAPERVLLS